MIERKVLAMNRPASIVVIAALLFVTSAVAQTATKAKAETVGKRELETLLSKQGFSGELAGKVRFTEVGLLECGKAKFQVFHYEWEQSNPSGAAIHYSQRLVFIGHNNAYAGSYLIEDVPSKVNRREIVFKYPPKLGNVIRCNETGLPKDVLLNGEPQVLFK